MWNPSEAVGNWIGNNVVEGGNNPWWNWYDFILPGSSAITTLTDAKGTQAANNQYMSQLSLQQQAQRFNADQAQLQRSWEEKMSNSEIQRRVADLKAAGLNPWLAISGVGSGASTPSGSSAQSSAGSADMANNKIVQAAGLLAVALRMFLTKGK